MSCKVRAAATLLVGVMILTGLSSAAVLQPATYDESQELPILSTFKEIHYDVSHNPDGTYVFSFSLPQQERAEERDADGKVTGSFAFVDNVGEEVSVRYDADEEGFHPESDALPQAPEDTPDVAQAREEFLRYYEETAKFLEELASDEDSSSSSEESDEDEDSDEDDDSESEESDEDEEEEEEEEEEEGGEEGENEATHSHFSINNAGKFGNAFGSRVPEQELSRATLAAAEEKTRKRAAFYPYAAEHFFGRRIPSSRQ